MRSLFGDPVVWAGLAFLALLVIQWWNAGRFPYFHPFEKHWVFTPAPYPGWPFAVERSDAVEMLYWFFPAWVLMLAFRYTPRLKSLATSVVWFLVVNAGLLAIFGIVQALSGTQKIFWITLLPEHFFASFGYDNHAASFFALAYALAVGVLIQALSQKKEGVLGRCRKIPLGIILAASVSAVLCVIALVLSLSRTGMVLAVGMSIFFLLAAVRLFWGRITVAQRVALGAALIMGSLTLFFGLSAIGGAALSHEAHKRTANLDAREFLIGSAAKIWMAEPWFGVGGWGFRHYVAVFAAEEPGRKLSWGFANTHNDTMQFLCEFGVIGFGLMLVAVWAYAWPIIRQLRRLTPFQVLAGVGLLAVLLHSQIDLPFRSPGILYSWLAVLGVSVAKPYGLE